HRRDVPGLHLHRSCSALRSRSIAHQRPAAVSLFARVPDAALGRTGHRSSVHHSVSPDLIAALPAVNATLNGISAVLLVTGYLLIRRRHVVLHKRCMLAAL